MKPDIDENTLVASTVTPPLTPEDRERIRTMAATPLMSVDCSTLGVDVMLRCADLGDAVISLLAALEQAEDYAKRYRERCIDAESEVASLTAERDEFEADYVAELQEVDKQKGMVATVTAERDRLTMDLAALGADRDRYANRCVDLVRERDALTAELDSLNANFRGDARGEDGDRL